MAKKKIAYFSAEYGLAQKDIPIYAGGLGILAGDFLRESSNFETDLFGIGFLYTQGFFKQHLDNTGWQYETYPTWDPTEYGLEIVKDENNSDLLVEVPFAERTIYLRVWKYSVGKAPLYLMDANIDKNSEEDKELTAKLYTGDWNLRFENEALLGIGGVYTVRALNIEPDCWHLNDDHATFSLLLFFSEYLKQGLDWDQAVGKVKKQFVFTTHTPVAGAESTFATETVEPCLEQLFSKNNAEKVIQLGTVKRRGEMLFSLTKIALELTSKKNAVSAKHKEVSSKMWSGYNIRQITNGVNYENWVSPPINNLLQGYLGEDWLSNSDSAEVWEKVINIPNQELWQARLSAKQMLLDYLSQFRLWEENIDTNSLFIGFARRFAPYKQPEILITSEDHLKNLLVDEQEPAHLFVSGKAHPTDKTGKTLLQQVYKADHDPEFGDYLIFCEDYNITLAHYLVAGVDVWINTPLPPMEACGTSGMKALLNGVLNASTLDGWWFEAFNGSNGWVIGSMDPEDTADFSTEAMNDALYYLLEHEIVPLYYNRENNIPNKWLDMVKNAWATTAPAFNTRRMFKDYQENLYSDC